MTAALSTDIAIKKWKPAKPREMRSVEGRDALYVRSSSSGAKAFYLRPDKSTWLKLGDFLTELARDRKLEDLVDVTKRVSGRHGDFAK